MTERLLQAHFTEILHIGQHETLADLAAEVGIDREAALVVLTTGQYGDEVRADQQEAVRLQVRGVPFFVINRKYAISGAQSSDVFLQAMQKAWEEDHPLTMVQGSDDAEVCTQDGCEVPSKDRT